MTGRERRKKGDPFILLLRQPRLVTGGERGARHRHRLLPRLSPLPPSISQLSSFRGTARVAGWPPLSRPLKPSSMPPSLFVRTYDTHVEAGEKKEKRRKKGARKHLCARPSSLLALRACLCHCTSTTDNDDVRLIREQSPFPDSNREKRCRRRRAALSANTSFPPPPPPRRQRLEKHRAATPVFGLQPRA